MKALNNKYTEEVVKNKSIHSIFIEQSPAAVAMFDKNMIYLAASKKWYDIYNLKEDIIGKSHYDVFPEIGEDWKQNHNECLKGAINISDEEPFMRLDGSVQWLSWEIRPWYDSDGDIGGLFMLSSDITELRAQKIQGDRIKKILASTTKVARIGTWELDLITEEYSLNKITKEILELPEEFYAQKSESLPFYKAGASKDTIISSISNLIKTGKPFDIELEMVTFKGNQIWVRKIGQAEYVNNRCVRVFGIFQDITDAKKSENELVRKNEILNFAEEITLMGNYQWDVVKNTSKWSKNLYKIFGLDESVKDFPYETYFSFVHPDDKEKVDTFVRRCVEEKTFPNNFVHRIITTSNEVKTVHLMGKIITNEYGEVVEIAGTCQDVTEQRMAEIKFRGLLESAPDAMVIVNENGKIHLINKQAESLFGYSAQELADQPIEILIPNRYIEEHVDYRNMFLKAPKQRMNFEGKELYGINKQGQEFPIQISLSPLKTEEGLLVSTAIRDITQQKESEQRILKSKENLEVLAKKLMKQNAQLADFAHITSHNLRAPVSNLNSLLDLYNALESSIDKEELFLKFENVTNHLTLTLNTLVEALKTKNEVSKITAVHFSEVFRNTQETLVAQIHETKAVIKSDFSEVDKIPYNRIYLESIFLNLIENAIKYRAKNRVPEIMVKTKLIKGKVQLQITDNGLGIDLDRHGHKLFGLNKVFHRHPDAKGVGLFITKVQVETMGGTISATSKVNVGTTFTIKF